MDLFDPHIAKVLGIISSICFALQYLPQTYLNFKRKSVKGFSTHGIIIKLVGASFLLVNSFLNGARENFFHWLLFPLVPYCIGVYAPQSLVFTNLIKPITQVLSHIPQLKVCMDIKTTSGVSMMSQHFNLIGGMFGIFMCIVIPPVSNLVYLIYINSVLQAVSIYALYFYYDYNSVDRKKSMY